MKKLILGFSISCLVMAGVGGLALAKMCLLNDSANILYSQHMLGLSAVKEANTDLIRLGRETRQAILDVDKAALERNAQKIEKYNTDYFEHLVSYEKTITSDEEKAELENARQGFSAYMVACRKSVDAARQDKSKEAAKLVAAASSAREKADAALEKLAKIKEQVGQEAFAAGNRAYVFWSRFVMGAMAGGIVLSLLIGSSISRMVALPLGQAVTMLDAVAKGDCTVHLDIETKDEVGRLGKAVNEMVASLRLAFGNIAKNAKSLAGSSTELSATATQMAGGAQQMNSLSSSAASSVEEMSAQMTSMAASSEQMTNNVKCVAVAVEEMSASVGEVAKSAENAASVAENAAKLASASNSTICQLGAAAEEIGRVIEVIQDIAEQTNLLALNATIEAARAGDAGKGFAVVATEVKELAKQTAGATDDIRRRIEAIQGSSREAIDSIEGIDKIIQEINGLSRTISSAVEEQSAATKEIARNVKETSSAVETVAQGVNQSATASKEISQNIAGVDQNASETARGAAAAQAASEELAQMAEQLQSTVAQFTI
jgi:methyl-accepting chemotaxis protein